MKKKILCIILSIALITGVPVPGNAEIVPEYIHVTTGALGDAFSIKAIHENNDIYITIEDIESITRYTLSESDGNYILTLGIKNVLIDVKKEQLKVLGATEKLSSVISYDDRIWLPLSELLPWLNVNCYMQEGVLQVLSDELSIYEVLKEYNPMDYYFQIDEQLGGTAGAATIMISMFLFDTIVDLRIDRAIPYKGGSLREYKLYKDLFAEFATDDFLLLDSFADSLEKVHQYGDIVGAINVIGDCLIGPAYTDYVNSITVLTEFIDFNKTLSALQYKNYAKSMSMVEIAAKTISDYPKSLEYIYDLEKPKYSMNISETAAFEMHKVFIDSTENIDVVLKDFALSVSNSLIKKGISAAFKEYTLGPLMTSLKGIDAVLSLTWPINKAAEGVTKLTACSDIHMDALDSFFRYYMITNMTEKNIEGIRLSSMMFLKSGIKAVEIKQTLMDRFGAKGLSEYLYDDYNDMLSNWALTAAAQRNDSINNKDEFSDNIIELFKNIGKLPAGPVPTDSSLEDFNFDFQIKHMEYESIPYAEFRYESFDYNKDYICRFYINDIEVEGNGIDSFRLEPSGREGKPIDIKTEIIDKNGDVFTTREINGLIFYENIDDILVENYENVKSIFIDGIREVTSVNLYVETTVLNIDFSKLTKFTNLKTVFIENIPDKYRLTGIENLVDIDSIKNLSISGSIDSGLDLAFIAGMQNLEYLNIPYFNNSWPIQQLSNLRQLIVGGAAGTDKIGQLASLQQLEINIGKSSDEGQYLGNLQNLIYLRLSMFSKTNAEFLLNLNNLQLLDISYIPSLKYLKNMKRLTWLKIGYSDGITDIKDLLGLAELQVLELRKCENLTSINGIGSFKALRELSVVWEEQISDLSEIGQLKKLTRLEIFSNEEAEDYSFLKNLEDLQFLELGHCDGVIKLSYLRNMGKVDNIYIRYCPNIVYDILLSDFNNVTIITE